MKYRSQRSKELLFLIIFLVILQLSSFMPIIINEENSYTNDKSSKNYNIFQTRELNTQGIVEDEFTEEWLKNGNFTSGTNPWYNTTTGDDKDIIASYSDGAANYEVKGEKRVFTSVANPPSQSNWTARMNPEFPAFPEWPETYGAGGYDQYGIDEYGCWVSHQWKEGPRQDPSVHWIQNITMPVNMSDYVITSASVKATVNGTVTASPGGWNQGGIDVPGDTMDQHVTYDYVRFYVLVSDIPGNKKYEIAYNKTVDLGKDSAGPTDSMSDTFMIQVPEEILIFYLTSVLQTDYRHFNITLGIRIHCEDSFSSDSDYWNELRINSFNLTFTYEKKIDKLTSLSWDQIGDKLTGSNVNIKEARLNFVYKINETWPTSLSPNSEIQIIINETKHPESIDLSDATISFKDAKTGGFDVTNLIKKDVNISLSIKVFLADDFNLDRTIRVTIDNVSLEITYTVSTQEEITELKLFLDGIDKTLDKSIEVPWREEVNISVMYVNKSSQAFIDNAYVTINGSGVSKIMPDNGFNNYTVLINTTELDIYGNNYLTIEASRRYYETQMITIKITVIDRPTNLDVAFDGIPTTNFDYFNTSVGKSLNITAWYKEADDTTLVESASVELFETGLGINPMPRNPLYAQYNITINTTDLGVGVKFLSISAEKENYTSRSETITVIVSERATEMRIWLNTTEKTTNPTIELNVNETLNITATYRDYVDGYHLSGANVRILGSGIDDNLTESISQEQYTYFLNTSDLSQGVNFVNILAEEVGYESQLILLTIIITERNTSIELYLNGTDFSHISPIVYNLTIGEFLNVTVKYKDWLTKAHIDLATVEIEGEGISKLIPENNTYGHYSIILDSEELNRGINFLTITAYKPNYQPRQKQIKIDIADKASIMNLYINGDNRTSDTFFNFFWGDPLNITVFYLENSSKQLIEDATIELVEGSTFWYDFPRNTYYDQYNRTISTVDLGIGTRSFLLIATKENYETITKSIILTVNERIAELQLFVDEVQMPYNGNMEVQVTDILNITVIYRDNITKQHIPSAHIELFGEDNFTESPYNHYNFTLNVDDLYQEGLATLIIIAEKTNYAIETFQFFLKIEQKQTKLDIFFNSANVTIDPTILLPTGSILNITVKFTDLDGLYLDNANVTLGLDFTANLTQQISYQQYYIIIDTSLLKIGVNIISLEAKKANHEIQAENLRIQIRKINTEIDTEDGEDTITIRPGEDVKITIEVKDLDFGGGIEDAEVTYEWKFGDGDLDDEGDGIYEVTLEDVPEGTYTITISVYKEGGRYEFDDLEITLVVKRPAEESLLFQILLIIAVIVGVSLAAYLIAYQKYLKYPKPVRKVRKYRKTLKKKKAPSIDIKSREKAFNESYSEELGTTAKVIKSKPKEEIASPDKLIKAKSLKSLKDKPKEELSEKTQKSLDDSKK